MTGLQEKHKEEVCRVREAHAGEVEALREERNVVGAKLAVKQEAIYKLETEIEAKCVWQLCVSAHKYGSLSLPPSPSQEQGGVCSLSADGRKGERSCFTSEQSFSIRG